MDGRQPVGAPFQVDQIDPAWAGGAFFGHFSSHSGFCFAALPASIGLGWAGSATDCEFWPVTARCPRYFWNTRSCSPVWARRRAASQQCRTRAMSWAAVGVLHVLAFHPVGDHHPALLEQPPPHHRDHPAVPVTGPQSRRAAGAHHKSGCTERRAAAVHHRADHHSQPIDIASAMPGARPRPRGDILGAVGRELACRRRKLRHLSGAERTACGGLPWRGGACPMARW